MAKEFDWGSSLRGGVEKFKGQKDFSYRMSILDKKPVVDKIHYIDRAYYSCPKFNNQPECPACAHAEALSAAGDKEGARQFQANWRLGAHVVLWTTAQDGRIVEPITFKIVVWIFGYRSFRLLSSYQTELGTLVEKDIKLSCTNQQYQHFDLMLCPQSIMKDLPASAQIRQLVMEEYQKSASDIGRMISRIASVQDIKDAMAGRAPNRSANTPPASRNVDAASTDLNSAARIGLTGASSEKQLFGDGQSAVRKLLQDSQDLPSDGSLKPFVDPSSKGPFPAPATAESMGILSIGKEKGDANLKAQTLDIDFAEGKVHNPPPAAPAQPIPVEFTKAPAAPPEQVKDSPVEQVPESASSYSNKVKELANRLKGEGAKQ